MRNNLVKALWGPGRDRGFTLVELLIVVLIVGILSAVALPLYLGYTKDARLAEGKSVAGSTMTSLSGCVQVKGAGGTCTRLDIAEKVGVDTSVFKTFDGRWRIATADLTVTTATPPQLLGEIKIEGQAGTNTAGMALSMFSTTGGVILKCNLSTNTPPAASTDGADC